MKRGTSGLSLIVGVNKPSGMSSHDVVNRCRRIFGERRVGHTGTLDPLASGVLPVCVGPATRLDAYLMGCDKRYRVRIAFGAATDTDDAAGEVIRRAPAPDGVRDPAFARAQLASMVGPQKQLPPVYSAIKVAGKKACDEARRGHVIDLAPRAVEIYSAHLAGIGECGEGGGEGAPRTAAGLPYWDVDFHVSSGTYIRALARDAGAAIGVPAHVAALERTQVGLLSLDECVTLETLAGQGPRAALDPVRLLGVRIAYAEGGQAAAVANGSPLPPDLPLYERRHASAASELCACTAGVRESARAPEEWETIAVVAENRLVALYSYEGARASWRARCVFSVGVCRGIDS